MNVIYYEGNRRTMMPLLFFLPYIIFTGMIPEPVKKPKKDEDV